MSASLPTKKEGRWSHVLKPSAAARPAYLEQARASDAVLRAHVEELLLADESAGFTAELASGLGATVRRAPGPEEAARQTIDMAEQQEPIARRVALKVIKLGRSTRNALARFEARRLALAIPFRLAFASLALAGGLRGANAETGKIKIDCEAGIAISLDGRPAGVTTYAGGGASLDRVPSGQRRIGIAKPGFKLEAQTVTVERGKTEMLAVFFLQPDPAAAVKLPSASADPLTELADSQRAVARATDRMNDSLRWRQPPSSNLEETLASAKEHTWEMVQARDANEAARWQRAEAEAAVAAQFRADYAAFHALRANRNATTKQKHAAWGLLLAKWKLPPDLGPCALVWRNHHVEAARGNLRVKLATAWPAGLEAPTRILDGRALPAEPADPRDPAFWEFRDLTAAPHTLRLEHPALEPTEGTLLVADSKTVVLTWVPRFKPTPPKR